MKRTGRSLPRVAALACVLAALPARADLEDELERAWVGAWVVVKVESASDCSGAYTNVEVRGLRSTSRGSRRFGLRLLFHDAIRSPGGDLAGFQIEPGGHRAQALPCGCGEAFAGRFRT